MRRPVCLTHFRFGSFSETKSVLFNAAYEVLITPNPATNLINIYFDKNNSNSVNIQLIDASGKLIRNIHSDQQTVQINTVGLGRGIYYVKVIDENNVIHPRSFLLCEEEYDAWTTDDYLLNYINESIHIIFNS